MGVVEVWDMILLEGIIGVEVIGHIFRQQQQQQQHYLLLLL